MNRKKNLSVIVSYVIIILLISCKSGNLKEDTCNLDIKFNRTYHDLIKAYTDYFTLEHGELLIDISNCRVLLEIITSNKGSVSGDHWGTVTYLNNPYHHNRDSALASDLNKWDDWYQTNKCSYKMDSLNVSLLNWKKRKRPYYDTLTLDHLLKFEIDPSMQIDTNLINEIEGSLKTKIPSLK